MTLASADFDYIRELVFDQTAIVLEPGKEYLVESRLVPVARDEGVEGVGELVASLRRTPDRTLRTRVIEAMTTNETSFFRDVAPFELLRTTVVPELIERRALNRALNIWCAAASSGQEPYSVAMILNDHFPELASWSVRILATDLSTAVIERARNAVYSQFEVNRGLPATMLVKHFDREGTSFALKDEIKKAIEFDILNLIRPWPSLPIMDIVFIRNVLIYFDDETKRNILGRVHNVLCPGGYLFLGGAESTMHLHDGFERVPAERAGCYRRVK
jgi:chemotaxis protein methyltransferase CheR